VPEVIISCSWRAQRRGLGFKDISAAHLTPAGGRTAFIGNSVDTWVAWDPFFSSALKQSEVKVLADGSNPGSM
jgi:sulfonate transport system substrate-binding protein